MSLSIKYESDGEKTLTTLIYGGEVYKFEHYSLSEAHRYINKFIQDKKLTQEDNIQQVVQLDYNMYEESDYGTPSPKNELVVKIVHSRLTGEFKHVKLFRNGKEMKND